MSAQAQMRALLDQLMGTARDGESERWPRLWAGWEQGEAAWKPEVRAVTACVCAGRHFSPLLADPRLGAFV